MPGSPIDGAWLGRAPGSTLPPSSALLPVAPLSELMALFLLRTFCTMPTIAASYAGENRVSALALEEPPSLSDIPECTNEINRYA